MKEKTLSDLTTALASLTRSVCLRVVRLMNFLFASLSRSMVANKIKMGRFSLGMLTKVARWAFMKRDYHAE